MDKLKKMVLNQHCFVLLLVKGKKKEVLERRINRWTTDKHKAADAVT
jgi:hypothetical protein